MTNTNTFRNGKENEGLYRQHGIITSTLTASGNSQAASIKVDYEEIGTTKVYASGSLKNAGSTTVIVRLQSIEFTNGYANITLGASEIVKFKNIRLDSVSCPAVAGQSASISVKFVCITYSLAFGEPEITFA